MAKQIEGWFRDDYLAEEAKDLHDLATELNRLRRMHYHGESADMKVMHDEMLSFGSPPARYVKQMMGLK